MKRRGRTPSSAALLLFLCWMAIATQAFLLRRPAVIRRPHFAMVDDDPWIQDNLREISSMSMHEIENELRRYNVMHCNNVSFKEELVYQLLKARIQNSRPPFARREQEAPPQPQQQQQYVDTRVYEEEEEYHDPYRYYADEDGAMVAPQQSQNNNNNNNHRVYVDPSQYHSTYHNIPKHELEPVITTPLFFASQEHPIPIILLEAHNEVGDRQTMALLIDTSCSGSCLRPSVVNGQFPTFHSANYLGTGTAVATGSTSVHRFSVRDTWVTAKPFDLAIENIGTNLPKTVDGILGMSFLKEFDSIEFDFSNGMAHLYTDLGNAPQRLEDDLATSGALTRLGMHPDYELDLRTAGIRLDGRGPVPMLVSTATTHSLLTWKGIDALELSRHSNEMTEIAAGAYATGNVASHFTHRVQISEKVELGDGKQLAAGAAAQKKKMAGVDCRGSTIDVGHFPMVGYSQLRAAFQRKDVGGIIGMDILSRCSVLRICCGGGLDEISMYVYPLPDEVPLKNGAG